MTLKCAVCGGNAPGRQWFNQDKGFGICAHCFTSIVEKEGQEQAVKSYGHPGIHHSPDRSPLTANQALFNHMSQEHGLTLLESEMHEIELICCKEVCAQITRLQNETIKLKEALKTCRHYASVGQCLPAAEYRRLFPEEGK